MPLVEVKDFASATQFKEYLRQMSPTDIIDTWAGCTPYEIFINRVKTVLIESASEMVFENNTGEVIELRLVRYIYDEHYKSSSIGRNSSFANFFSSEMLFFGQNGKPIYSANQIMMLDTYTQFLIENEGKLIRIDKIPYCYQIDVEKFSRKLKSFYKSESLKLHQLDEQFAQLFEQIDGKYELFEKSFKCESDEKRLQKEDFLFIDWDYLKKPFQLEDDIYDVIEFVKALIDYFREELYQRKLFFQWRKTPNTYLIIEYFIEELKQEILLLKNTELLNKEVQQIQFTSVENYPKFIYASQKDYEFFYIMASQATLFVQVSFLFRQMSEKEKPLMIIAKDAVFRDWFNTQDFKIKLDTYTVTFDKAQNADRIWFYNTAKMLFFS